MLIRGGGIKKIDIPNERIELVSTTSATPHDLAGQIVTTEPRYSFFRYEHDYEGETAAPIVFIYTCPPDSKIKEKMLYASSKAGVVATAESEAGVVVGKRVCFF